VNGGICVPELRALPGHHLFKGCGIEFAEADVGPAVLLAQEPLELLEAAPVIAARALIVVHTLYALQAPRDEVGCRLGRVIGQFVLHAGFEAFGSDGHGRGTQLRKRVLRGALDLSQT